MQCVYGLIYLSLNNMSEWVYTFVQYILRESIFLINMVLYYYFNALHLKIIVYKHAD